MLLSYFLLMLIVGFFFKWLNNTHSLCLGVCVCMYYVLVDKSFFNQDLFFEMSVFQSLKIVWVSKDNPIFNLIHKKLTLALKD